MVGRLAGEPTMSTTDKVISVLGRIWFIWLLGAIDTLVRMHTGFDSYLVALACAPRPAWWIPRL